MSHEPVIEELHRHREELFAEFGNDPEALLRYLQQKEAESGRVVKAPEPPRRATRCRRLAPLTAEGDPRSKTIRESTPRAALAGLPAARIAP